MRDRHRIPITILICDDDEGDRMLMQLAFDDAHISNDLRFVRDGDELLDYLYQRGEFGGETGAAPRPGLVLLDLDMPQTDGRATLNAIKTDPELRDIAVVMLTGSASDITITGTYPPGQTAFITKPVTCSGLIEALNELGAYWFEIVELPPAALP